METLVCENSASNKTFTVEIGIWNGTSFTSKSISAEYDLQGEIYYIYDYVGFTVPQNQKLAARVNNIGTVDFTLRTDGSCSILYPCDIGYPGSPTPDLNITEKSETLLEDGNFTVNYTVKNIGTATAGASNTTIYIDGVNVLEDPVPALTANASNVSTVGPFDCPCGQILNVTVCADNSDVVVESDETNNCMVNFLKCSPCATPVPEYSMTGLLALLVIMSIVLASVVLKGKKRSKK